MKIEQSLWEQEHQEPILFPQLHSSHPSGGVERFLDWLNQSGVEVNDLNGLEIGCGKGRNTIWLAENGLSMCGFDFSEIAITDAQRRSSDIPNSPKFVVADILEQWPYENSTFDLIVDCFALIEITTNIKFVFAEIDRSLKPGGYFFSYSNSELSEAYQIFSSDKLQPNTYQYPDTKKVERVFSHQQFNEMLPNFSCLKYTECTRMQEYNGKSMVWHHIWTIYQKNT